MPRYRIALWVEVADTGFSEAQWVAEWAVKTLDNYGVTWGGFIAQQTLPPELGVGQDLNGTPMWLIPGTPEK